MRVQPPQRLVCPLPASDAFGTVCEHIGPQLGLPKGDEQGVRDSSIAKDTALMQMQATSILLLAALMPAASLLAQTPSPRHLVHVSAKKKPATAGGFGAAAPSTPKKKKKKTEDEPGLARPWDTDDSDENATRAQKRGGKIGKRGDRGGPAPQPSGGMSAGVKLN